MLHLSSNKLIDDSQHGFLLSHSTAFQLLEHCYDWNKSADEENQQMLSILILAWLLKLFRMINLLISLSHINFVLTL